MNFSGFKVVISLISILLFTGCAIVYSPKTSLHARAQKCEEPIQVNATYVVNTPSSDQESVEVKLKYDEILRKDSKLKSEWVAAQTAVAKV